MKARRFVSMLLCICMMMGMVLPLEAAEVDTPEIPVTLNETEIKADEIWDGSIANSFANGTGTEDDPYQIETASEFGYFISQLENGVEYKDTYFELRNNLYLNDEIFTTDFDTGMVIVREKDLITYYQSYTKGFQGGNTQFDTTATGGWHKFNTETMMYEKIASYQGNINRLNSKKNNQNKFRGNFNGNNHIISGIYAYESGIFGYLYGTVENLTIANSFFTGNSEQGAIARRNYGIIDNCEVDAIVIGGESTGGITGVNIDTVQNTVSYATVFCHDNNAGGLAGYNTQDIIGCTNYGIIIGNKDNVGGITGYQYVRSEENKADEVIVTNSVNYANIYGGNNVGGIIGGAEVWGFRSPAILNIIHTNNYGMISGTSKIGGIIGKIDASKWDGSQINLFSSANHGTIIALADYVGGIVGYSRTEQGFIFVPGLKSFLKISQCYNNGSITGSRYIGGLMGYQYLWYHCYADINNCYNNATVSGSSHVGGMVGYIDAFNTNFNLQNIYTTQYPISEDECYGGVASYVDVSLHVPYLRNLYCTTTDNMQSFHHLRYSQNEDTSDKIYNIIAYSEEKAQLSSSYIGFNFDTVWEIGETDGYSYPTLRNNTHISSSIELPYQVPHMIVLSETEDVPTYITWTPCDDAVSYKVIVKNSDTVVSESVVSADHYSFSIEQEPGTYTACVYAIYDNAETVSNNFTYIVSATEQDNTLPTYTVPYGTPVIDFINNTIDEIWNTAEWIDISQKSYDFAPDSITSARAKILNDDDNVYFLVEIKDDTPYASSTSYGSEDCFVAYFIEDIEFYEDLQINDEIQYENPLFDGPFLNVSVSLDGTVELRYDEETAAINEYSITLRDTDTYTIEFSLKLKTGTPIDLKSVLLDMQYIDYDEDGINGSLGWVTDPDSWTIDDYGTLNFSENTAVCEHTNHGNDTWISCNYRNIDDPTVHERQDVYAHSCTDCGEPLPNAYDEWEPEEHLWDGNTCTQCGYVKVEEVCEHKNLNPDAWKSCNYRNIDDTTVHERQNLYARCCADCGEALPDAYDEWVTEDHTFDGDTCTKCLYVKVEEVCEHINKTTGDLKDSDFRIIDDAVFHERQDIFACSCSDCGEPLPDIYGEWNPEEHSWDGNSCSLCGYTVIAEPEEIAPTITGLKDSYTITIGESLTLDGIVTAAEDGKLGKVTLKHNEYGTSFESRTLNVGYTSATANLSDLGALTTDAYPLNAVGTYEFRIFASADNYTDTNNLIATFTVTVTSNVCTHANTIIINATRDSYSQSQTDSRFHTVHCKDVYRCVDCRYTSVDYSRTYDEEHSGKNAIEFRDDGYICVCGYEYLGNYKSWVGYIQFDKAITVYKYNNSNSDSIGTVYGLTDKNDASKVTVMSETLDDQYYYIEYESGKYGFIEKYNADGKCNINTYKWDPLFDFSFIQKEAYLMSGSDEILDWQKTYYDINVVEQENTEDTILFSLTQVTDFMHTQGGISVHVPFQLDAYEEPKEIKFGICYSMFSGITGTNRYVELGSFMVYPGADAAYFRVSKNMFSSGSGYMWYEDENGKKITCYNPNTLVGELEISVDQYNNVTWNKYIENRGSADDISFDISLGMLDILKLPITVTELYGKGVEGFCKYVVKELVTTSTGLPEDKNSIKEQLINSGLSLFLSEDYATADITNIQLKEKLENDSELKNILSDYYKYAFIHGISLKQFVSEIVYLKERTINSGEMRYSISKYGPSVLVNGNKYEMYNVYDIYYPETIEGYFDYNPNVSSAPQYVKNMVKGTRNISGYLNMWDSLPTPDRVFVMALTDELVEFSKYNITEVVLLNKDYTEVMFVNEKGNGLLFNIDGYNVNKYAYYYDPQFPGHRSIMNYGLHMYILDREEVTKMYNDRYIEFDGISLYGIPYKNMLTLNLDSYAKKLNEYKKFTINNNDALIMLDYLTSHKTLEDIANKSLKSDVENNFDKHLKEMFKTCPELYSPSFFQSIGSAFKSITQNEYERISD